MEEQLELLNKIAKQLKLKANIRAKNIDDLLNWKQIVGYDYSVSRFGQVRNDETGRILKGRMRGKGYLAVALYKQGTRKNISIHTLVANTFLENPHCKPMVDHIDENKRNNNVDNLRFATDSENQRNRSLTKKNTSGIKGVSFNKQFRKWIAKITVNRKQIHLGIFSTIEEAKEARQAKVKQLFGEFANNCEQ